MINTGAPCASLISSVPGAPGRRRSLTTRSKLGMLKRSWASCTEPASLTWYWLRSSRRRRAERIMVSSSTMRICGINSVLSTVSVHSGRRFNMPGQFHPKTGAALALGIGWAVDGDLAIMLFHDRIDQCKAKASALSGIFGGEKWFEQTVHDGFRNSAAFVLHQQLDGVLVGFGFDPNGAAWLGGIAGIGQQVDQYLGQALSIPGDQVLGVAEVEELHVNAVAVEGQQADGILGDIGQAHGLGSVLVTACMGEVHQ